MKITKAWFYKLSEFKEQNIEVGNNISATFFDDGKNNKKIFLWKNSEIYICGFLEKKEDYSIKIIQKEESSKVFVNYLLFSKNYDELNVNIHSKIESNFSKSKLNIISFVLENWQIDLDWILEFEKDFSKMSWKLEEENIFLWENWQVRWVPTLLVKSNDVKASHSCKIQKISDEKLFYLRSRWLKKENAISLLIKAKVEIIFGKIKDFDEDFYKSLCKNIFDLIY